MTLWKAPSALAFCALLAACSTTRSDAPPESAAQAAATTPDAVQPVASDQPPAGAQPKEKPKAARKSVFDQVGFCAGSTDALDSCGKQQTGSKSLNLEKKRSSATP